MPRFGKRKRKSKKNIRKWAAPQLVQSIPRVNAFPLQIARRATYEQQWRIHNGPGTATSVGPTQVLRLNLNSLFSHPYGYENQFTLSTAGAVTSYAQIAPLSATFPRPFPNQQGISKPVVMNEFPHHPAGIFDNDTSPGNLYQKYCVIGTKVTVVYIPQAPDRTGSSNLANGEGSPPITTPSAMLDPQANQSAPSMVGVNISYNGHGADWITPDTHWQDIKDRPQVKAVRVQGNYASAHDGVENRKTSKQAAFSFTFTPRQGFSYDSIQDAESLWGQTGLGSKNNWGNGNTPSGPVSHLITQPEDLATASIFLTQLFPTPGFACVSGTLQLKVEKTILFKEPYVSNEAADDAQNGAPMNTDGGAAGNHIPQSALWRAGSTLGAVGGMAASLMY